jgi:hypothetical protein
MLSLRGVLQESASQARRGARGLSVPTGGRELADPWCHVCGRVCEFALKSFVRVLGGIFPENTHEPAEKRETLRYQTSASNASPLALFLSKTKHLRPI